MIPKALHQVWIGPRPVPEAWARDWRAMYPDWDYHLWRDADIAALGLVNRSQYDWYLAHGLPWGAADVARAEILARNGGVYADIDSRPLRPINGALMASGFFAGMEPGFAMRVANGVIGARPGHPALWTYVDAIGKATVLDPPWDTVGGTFLTAALLLHVRCCPDIVLCPPRTFYPTNSGGLPTPGDEEPYTEHFWASTHGTYPQ